MSVTEDESQKRNTRDSIRCLNVAVRNNRVTVLQTPGNRADKHGCVGACDTGAKTLNVRKRETAKRK